jgi:hypothetical protein
MAELVGGDGVSDAGGSGVPGEHGSHARRCCRAFFSASLSTTSSARRRSASPSPRRTSVAAQNWSFACERPGRRSAPSGPAVRSAATRQRASSDLRGRSSDNSTCAVHLPTVSRLVSSAKRSNLPSSKQAGPWLSKGGNPCWKWMLSLTRSSRARGPLGRPRGTAGMSLYFEPLDPTGLSHKRGGSR